MHCSFPSPANFLSCAPVPHGGRCYANLGKEEGTSKLYGPSATGVGAVNSSRPFHVTATFVQSTFAGKDGRERRGATMDVVLSQDDARSATFNSAKLSPLIRDKLAAEAAAARSSLHLFDASRARGSHSLDDTLQVNRRTKQLSHRRPKTTWRDTSLNVLSHAFATIASFPCLILPLRCLTNSRLTLALRSHHPGRAGRGPRSHIRRAHQRHGTGGLAVVG